MRQPDAEKPTLPWRVINAEGKVITKEKAPSSPTDRQIAAVARSFRG